MCMHRLGAFKGFCCWRVSGLQAQQSESVAAGHTVQEFQHHDLR
jgi:hypothetical protein